MSICLPVSLWLSEHPWNFSWQLLASELGEPNNHVRKLLPAGPNDQWSTHSNIESARTGRSRYTPLSTSFLPCLEGFRQRITDGSERSGIGRTMPWPDHNYSAESHLFEKPDQVWKYSEIPQSYRKDDIFDSVFCPMPKEKPRHSLHNKLLFVDIALGAVLYFPN